MKNYFMCRPQRNKPNGLLCTSGSFYVRFYSRDPFPWYQASVVVQLPQERELMFQFFQEFIGSAEAHRQEKNGD